jgi:hypothetical protein
MYCNGQGVSEDYATAVKWYTLAAEQGSAVAQANLGWIYENGRGVPQDYATAVKWYTLAAKQGSAEAQFNLGVMYYDGRGVSQSYFNAYVAANISSLNGYEHGSELRDRSAEYMTPSQIEEAQEVSGYMQND